MKSIAIVGDASSIWVKSFVGEVLVDYPELMVTIFTDKISAEILESYSANNVILRDCSNSDLIEKIKLGKLSYWRKVKSQISKTDCFDVIHIQFVNQRKLFLLKCLKQHYKKAVVTFWGSDLLRRSDKELMNMIPYLRMAHTITVGADGMKNYLSARFPEDIVKKTRVVHYGVNSLKAINEFNASLSETKEKWGVPNDRLVVTIGYNGSKQQNHLSIIKSISEISENIRRRLFVIIPVTYGLDEDYYQEIELALEKSEIDFRIRREYMGFCEIAELCFITDVFIHGQATDALSASVQEYLCAGKLLLNPTWIKYEELKEKSVYYWEYDGFDQLPQILTELVNRGVDSCTKEKLENNRRIICEMSSWDRLKVDWMVMYRNIEN